MSDAIETRQAVRIGLMRTTLHLVSTRDALGLAPIMDDVLRRVYRIVGAWRRSSATSTRHPSSRPLARSLTAGPLTPADLGAPC